MIEALKAFRPTGSVLELACGPGVWTGQLMSGGILRAAASIAGQTADPWPLLAPPAPR